MSMTEEQRHHRITGTWSTPGVEGHRDDHEDVQVDPDAAHRIGFNETEALRTPTRPVMVTALVVAVVAMVVVPLYSYILRLGVTIFNNPMVWVVLVASTVLVACAVGRRAEPHKRVRAVIGSIGVGLGINMLVISLTAYLWSVI